MTAKAKRIDAFEFKPGRVLAGKYTVVGTLGAGWEGEVFQVVEGKTGIHRAAKVFYPHRNAKDRAVKFYATKLNRLRRCGIVIQYHHSISIRHRGIEATCLIGEFVEGELLATFIASQRGKRLPPFEALHLLYALAVGVEQIHRAGEYHGDLHSDNVIVRRRGISFDVRLVDFYHWGPTTKATKQEDVIQLIHLLHEALGGRKHYAAQSAQVKQICRGLRRGLITRKFPTAVALREHLEAFPWDHE